MAQSAISAQLDAFKEDITDKQEKESFEALSGEIYYYLEFVRNVLDVLSWRKRLEESE